MENNLRLREHIVPALSKKYVFLHGLGFGHSVRVGQVFPFIQKGRSTEVLEIATPWKLDKSWYCLCAVKKYTLNRGWIKDPQFHDMLTVQIHRMRLLGLIMGLVLFGCAGLDREEPAQGSGLPAMQSDDEAQKTLQRFAPCCPSSTNGLLFLPTRSTSRSLNRSRLHGRPIGGIVLLADTFIRTGIRSNRSSVYDASIFFTLQASGCFSELQG